MLPSEQAHHDLDEHLYYSPDMFGQLMINENSISNNNNNTTRNSSQQRTIYLGNVPANISVSDVMDQVRIGPIQAVRPLPEKNGLFITFVDSTSATQFFHEATINRFAVLGHELKIGWGKPSHLTSSISNALQNGASRCVYLNQLDETVTEQQLKEDLSRFGHIEHIKIIPDKKIAFVHFLCISNAVKCVNTLNTEPQWQSKRIAFGKDRCQQQQTQPHQQLLQQQQQQQKLYILPPPPPLQHHHAQQQQQPQQAMKYFDSYNGLPIMYSNHTSQLPPQPLPSTIYNQHQHQHQHQYGGFANRTIYLGNIHPDTTAEDICNVVRGGILSQIRFIPDKHIAFITFVDPILAEAFFNSTECLVIKSRRLKIGWGKASTLPLVVLNAVQNGGSRNVYIGNIDDSITEEKLKYDFSEYGDIELVNTLKEKSCAFVNFTSIAGAVRAIEGIRSKEEYKKFRINYGKDRCGNPPRFTNNNNNTTNNSSKVNNTTSNNNTLNNYPQQHYMNENEEESTNTTTTTSNITTPNTSTHLLENDDLLVTSSSSPV